MSKFVFLLAFILLAGASARSLRVYDATKECLRNVQDIANVFPKVFGDMETKDFAALTQDFYYIKDLFNRAKTDCAAADVRRFINQTTIQGPAECINDIIQLIPHIQKLVEDLASGNFTAIIEDIQHLMPLVQKAIQDCSQSKNTKLFHILNQFNSDQCERVKQSSLPAFEEFYLAIYTKNYAQAVKSAPAFIGKFSAILQGCKLAPVDTKFVSLSFIEEAQPNSACSDDIAAVIQLVTQLVQHLQAGDIGAVIQDVTKLIPLLQKTAEDCTQAVRTIDPTVYLNRTTVQDFAKCIQDVMNLVPKLQKLIADVQSGNFSAIIEDIQVIIPLVNQTIADCSSAKQTKIQYLINVYKTEQCTNDAQTFVMTLYHIDKFIQTNQLEKIHHLIPEAVKGATRTINSCSKRRHF